jgi:hypothetical protein
MSFLDLMIYGLAFGKINDYISTKEMIKKDMDILTYTN